MVRREVLLGNMLRKMLGTHCFLDGNTMRTWWEYLENNKGLTPLAPTLPKRGPLDASCNSLVEQNFQVFPIVVITCFGLGQ